MAVPTLPKSAVRWPCLLPHNTQRASTVWTGSQAYLFGGDAGGAASAAVLRVREDIATAEVASSLPSPRTGTSAAFDGTYAYVFGGASTGAGPLADIVRFEPATGVATTMSAGLPSPRWGTSAVWDGDFVHVFGGRGTASSPTSCASTRPPARSWWQDASPPRAP